MYYQNNRHILVESNSLSASTGIQKIHSTVFYLFTYLCDLQYYQISLLYFMWVDQRVQQFHN